MNDTMERSYDRNNGKIVGRHAVLDHDKYKEYRDTAERAAKTFSKGDAQDGKQITIKS